MAKMENTSPFKADFPKLVDISKVMTEFKMPNFDMNALMEIQRKNIEAITAINQAAFDNFQSFASRQATLIRQSLEGVTNLVNELMSSATPQEKIMHQAEASKNAVEQCFTNVHDAAETLSKCNTQVMDAVSGRMTEGLEELKGLIKKNDLAA